MQFEVHYFETVSSTMDLVREKADEGIDEGFVVQGGMQTEGRGRRGNQWESPAGNLYQSFILRPIRPRQEWGQLSFVIAVALSNALQDGGVGKHCINLKWPNDVMLDGQKCAGILIESAPDYLIVGTGVNIAFAPIERSKLSDYGITDRDGFRDIFLEHIKQTYDLWQNHGFEPVRAMWMEYAYCLGQNIEARLNDVVYEGIFQNIDCNGTLLLTEKDGTTRKINAGEILYVPSH